MKPRTAAMIVGIAIIAAVPATFILLHNRNEAANEAGLAEQLRLARAEGIPTTWQEYGRQIKPVPPDENAAPLYKRLTTITYSTLARISDTTKKLYTNPEPATLTYARQILNDNAKAIAILDAGSKLPHCWFDVDWSRGLIVPHHDVLEVAHACRLLELRAALAAANGDHSTAVRNIGEAATIARQIGEEGGELPEIAAETTFGSAVHISANLAFRFRNTDTYSKALGELVQNWPKPNARRMKRDDLLIVLDIVRLSTTPEGRRELGLEERDVPPMESINPWLVSRTRARTDVVRAESAIWQAMDLPYRQRKTEVTIQIKAIERALAAYPSGLVTYMWLIQPDAVMWMHDFQDEAGRLLYAAAYRALSHKQIPKAIKTGDLRSPYDGTAAGYSFDGKRITITVSDPEADGGTKTLMIPPALAPGRPKAP